MAFTLAQSKHQTQRNKKNNIHLWQNPGLSRKKETVINRLRIGHTHLTHSYLITKQDPPSCEICGVIININNPTYYHRTLQI